MKLNKLLEKQLDSLFPLEYRDKPEFKAFISAVNNSYNVYDHDLEEEIALKRASVHKLKEVVAQVGDGILTDENDLFDIAAVMKKQVALFNETRKKQAEQQCSLKKSEEKYRKIIENMHLGLLQVSPNEEIMYANQSFCNMSGYTIDELIGKNAPSLFVNPNNKSSSENVIERRKAGHSDAYELQALDHKGKERWWMISGTPMLDDNNEFIGSIGIHLDISPQKKLEKDLRQAKADAENSAKTKELFLANMSHEIRTPMNAIIGLGRLLAKTKLDNKQGSYLDIILNASDNLLVIINDLLDFSKIEAGKVSLENIGFGLKEYMRSSLQILKHKAEEKGLALTCICDESIADVLIGDPYRLNQVLMNLFSNSIKFTEQGEVTLECKLLESNARSQVLLFKVTDTGSGMSDEFLNHLFDKFSQEDESITRKFGGTGLGMSISKQLIELMGGKIKVESVKNTGTTISFALRFAIGTEHDMPKNLAIETDTQILKDKRILLVEDNPMNRILASTILSQYGAGVTEAENGAVAIDKLKTGTYDMVLMDMRMPVMNGLDATKYIRANIDTAIPIIALTANAFKQEEQRCLDAGMNDFISKPFDEDKMVQLIAQWLGRETKINTKPKIAARRKQQVEEALFDLDLIREISKGDERFMVRLSEIFIGEIRSSIAQMEEACEAKDWRRLGDIVHRIKPSMRSYKVNSIADDLEQLEKIDPSVSKETIIIKQIQHVKEVSEKVSTQLARELNL